MKLIAFILLASCLTATANGFSQKVTLSVKDAPLSKVFKEIKKQTGYVFFYEEASLSQAQKVTLQVKDFPLENALTLCFRDQPLSYSIVGKTVVIRQSTTATSQLVDKKTAPLPVVELPPVTGTVTADGVPLQGATITIKGTRTSVTTNANGVFSITIEPGQTLVISYIGYQTIEEAVSGRSVINIALKKADTEIEQVVVTALGISRKVKTLTYNVQEIKGDDISGVNNGNFVNSLVGKVAGATINSSAAGNGASARVVLRGVKSISLNNNVLYVIDGIPMPNNIRGQADDIFSGAGQTGDFVANLNPDDIESLSVLSGPAAATLYGSSGSNGVIVITTKKGQKDRTAVSVSNNTTFSSPLILPKFQNTYGLSEIGSYYSWGDKLITPSTYKPGDFFQTGINNVSGLTFSTGSEKNQTYISLGHTDSKGIIPNNKFGRSNLTVRNTSTFLDGKMSLDISFMTGLVNEQNMISQGQYFNPLVAVYLFPPGDDFNKVKAFERYDPSRNIMKQAWQTIFGDNGLMMQNPYWVTHRDLFENKKERYMATASLKYNLASWINLQGRAKLDKANDKNERKFAATTNELFASENGFYALQTFNNRQIYAEGLANINKTFGTKYSLTANVGTAIEDIVNDQYTYGGKLQGVANLYTFGNIAQLTAQTSQTGYHRQKQSVFGTTQLGYQNKLFVDLTARNDWASTLAGADKKSFFYSSAGVSAILSDIFKMRSNILSYLKVRASYSEVGNEPGDGLTNPTYPLAGGFPRTFTRMKNTNLQPERTKSWELGLNAAFFKGALRFDATVYKSSTFNQFFNVELSSATGNDNGAVVNGGQIDNKGIEASLKYTKKFGDVSWSSYATFSLNRNKIVELLREWKNPETGEIYSLLEIDQAGTGSYKMRLKEGGSINDIYVNTLRVDEHGAIYVDPGSQTVVAEPNKFILAGNSNPRYNIGWGNTLNWKGIGLNFLFAGRIGGIVVSNTQAIMDAFGVSQASADARDNGGAIVNGRPVPAKEYYSVVGAGASGGIASMYCYSATNVRLAELSLGYDIPMKKLGKVNKYIKGANVSFTGRNLFLLFNEAPFDPELTSNTGTYFQGIDYFMMPSLRSMGFSVKLNF